MNRQPDVELVLRDYFADDGLTAPDYVLDVVEQRIGRQPRRRIWRLHWRPEPMNRTLTYAAAAAAVLVVAVVGYNLLSRTGPGPGVQPTPSPNPTASAVPTATPALTPTDASVRDVPDAGSVLAPGQWRFRLSTDGPGVSVVAAVPEGWNALEDQHGIENTIATNSAPGGIAILFERPAHGLFSDPCHWDSTGSGIVPADGDVAVGSTAADLVGALQSNKSYLVGTPSQIAFGAYTGQQLELRFPVDLDPTTCNLETGDDAGTYRLAPDTAYAQGKANIWRLSIVDVAGTRIVAIIEFFPGTSPDTLAEAKAIVDSFVFSQ